MSYVNHASEFYDATVELRMKIKDSKLYISVYTQYISPRYTFGQKYITVYTEYNLATFGRVTQYMSVYLSMNFSGKVYPRIS